MSYSIEPAYTMVMELSRQLVLPKSEQIHNIEHVYATATTQAYSATAEAAVRQALYNYFLAPLLKLQSRQSI